MKYSSRCVNCIIPPYMMRKLLESADPALREIALRTLLATSALRAERTALAGVSLNIGQAGTKRRSIFNCQESRFLTDAELVRGETDAVASDGSVNRAFDGLGRTYDFFNQVFKRNSIDGKGMRLDGYVHYDSGYNNAFWNGRQMVFGDGDGILFRDFTRSLDVIAHELSHGVTERAAGLEYRQQPGALNESMSDVFGSLVKQWVLGQTVTQADWLIGNDIFTPSIKGDALRSLKSPGSAYSDERIGSDPQPKHMNDYQNLPVTEEGDWGGVHVNSGIPNHAFYLYAMALGGRAWDGPGMVWYAALKASSPTTDFAQFAALTMSFARQTYGVSHEIALKQAWKDVGIDAS